MLSKRLPINTQLKALRPYENSSQIRNNEEFLTSPQNVTSTHNAHVTVHDTDVEQTNDSSYSINLMTLNGDMNTNIQIRTLIT